ncbi:oxygen-dependent coproporphyrinogen oxidase [Sunxiuqinia sp. A32]|uniref:oxygen-dependent coproporphyrinogen oxidase n=1 Tax=Sunxiuqinia sp. A32 TaxID=3461496 RepID=UPI0040468600
MQYEKVATTYRKLQQEICTKLEQADGKSSFITDEWETGIGSGATMVFTNGDAIEKAAVNFSAVKGSVSENMRKSLDIESGASFSATGISSIIHPQNPHAPITHMNVRYFELDSGISWFGGGVDLTPHYVNLKEASWFHQQLKEVCDPLKPGIYDKYKVWADDYFYLPHRKETRGVGGIFFDHVAPVDERRFDQLFAFTQELANAYPRIYIELLNKNRNKDFTEAEKQWQMLRRGRYVEFNLLYDRGTKFGLDSRGRTESIFLSMPPLASWEYQNVPEEGTKEAETLRWLKKDIDWLHVID